MAKTPKIEGDFFSMIGNDASIDEVEDTTEEVEEENGDLTDEEREAILKSQGQELVEEEETEEEEQEVDDVVEDDDEDFYTTIINDQAEKGVLYFDEDKTYEGNGEEIFDEVITDTLNKRWEEEYVASIPEEYQSLFTALRAGKSVTEWVENTQPTDYSKVDMSDEDNQKALIEDHLTLTGMDEEDIKDTIQEYEDAGTLEKNSKKALKYLQKNEDKKAEKYERALEAEQARKVEQQEEDFARFKSQVLSTEELGKMKLSKKEREQLFDHITKPVNKKGESQLVINQKNKDAQLLMAYMDMKGFDFSKLEQAAESRATGNLRAKLSKTTDLNAKSTGTRVKEEVTSAKLPTKGMPWSSR